MKIECGGLLFTSDFDSGNLDKVEFVEPIESNKLKIYGSTSDASLPPISNYRIRRQKSHPDSPVTSPVHNKKYQLKKRTLYSKLKSTVSAESVCSGLHQPIREFKVWTRPDCSGTNYETTFRTWFYFGISGGPPGIMIKINEGWKRISGKVDFRCATDGNFIISFCHTLPLEQDSITYFAFTYPFSYTECQNMLDDIDNKMGSSLYISKNNKPPDNTVYYCRELLCHSLGGNKIELLTISSCKGLMMEREKKLPDLFPEVSKPRCHIFKNKKIVFISSRVHPGETPSSFVFNGMLQYLLGSKDSIASRLRNLFVFKLIPMLNPDGVCNGHYRADIQGLNLNRIYMVADFQHHPSIYAARTLLLHYHTFYSGTIDTSHSSSKSSIKKSKHNSQLNIGLSQNQIVPVVLPIVKGTSIVSGSDSNQDADGPVLRPFLFHTTSDVNESSQNMPMEDAKDTRSSTDLCHECKLSDFPSKKITLESDLSCNCIEPSDADDSSSFDCEARFGEGACVDCMFLPKLMSINCPYFDFSACNFSAENMYSGSNSNIQSKEGSGRVSLYVLTGIIHSYTLECNYNTCRFTSNQKRSKKSPVEMSSQVFFTPEIYQQKLRFGNRNGVLLFNMFTFIYNCTELCKGRSANHVKKFTPLPGSRSQDKISTRSMTIRRSLFSSSNKGLQRESSSSTTNLSSNASDSEVRNMVTNRSTRSRTLRGTKSLLSSPRLHEACHQSSKASQFCA
ncbi:hypothetical protein CEXT_450121 [Caerostris extrusa]|uniref:tubulin-glutamate carboxypeptidase n=1 Tax=Caerostris extrusa TaxID=172846 RepID=A0AAV4XSM0_CAEEX|nr:hypothetical protein CEXT_450121 [Caerostris extrusa]